MWIGVIHYVCGELEWENNSCSHGQLTDVEDKKEILVKNSKTAEELGKIVFDAEWLKSLQHYVRSHGGARPPPLCARHAWVVFFKMAPKKSAKASGFRHIGFISQIGRVLDNTVENWYEQCYFGGHLENV